MGHDVRYLGKLTPKKPLNEIEINLFNELQDEDNYDRLYALEYRDNTFQVNNNYEKIYVDEFFEVVEKYIYKLKEGGNDLKEGSYLVSCSEYGMDDECAILLYKNGKFEEKSVLELIEEYVSRIG